MKTPVYSCVKTNFLAALAILAVFINFGSSAEARNGDGYQPLPPRPVDKRVLVDGVDISNQKITLLFKKDGTKHVYLVDMATVVKIQGNTGTITDINAGQLVASYVERDSSSLDSIEIATDQKPPANKSNAPEAATSKPSPSVNPAPTNSTTDSPSSSPDETNSPFGSPIPPPQNANPAPSNSPSSSPDGTNSPFGSPIPPPQNANPPQPPKSVDGGILVEGVDVSNRQITLIHESDHTKHVYLIDPATVVTVDGNSGTIKNISVGQMVASYVEQNSTTLVSIKIVSP